MPALLLLLDSARGSEISPSSPWWAASMAPGHISQLGVCYDVRPIVYTVYSTRSQPMHWIPMAATLPSTPTLCQDSL